jgi:GT2 family glycosyltransferase
MPLPLVAIHIVTHNNQKTIGGCLKSLQKQTFKDFRTIVVDNHSSDKTLTFVENFKIPVIRNTENLGYAAAQNQALELSQSRYVLTLNSDVFLDKNCLRFLVSAMEKKGKRVGSANAKLYRLDRWPRKSSLIDSAGLFIQRNRRQGLLFENQPAACCPTAVRPIFGPDGAAAFYRRAMLEDIKIEGEYFDEDFFMQKEDIDVAWRAQLFGWQSIFVPKALAYHLRAFRPGQRKNVSSDLRRLGIRNRYYLIIKNDLLKHFLKDLVPIMIYDLEILFYILLFEQKSLFAYLSLLKNLGKLFTKRKIIQARRRVSDSQMRKWFL